VGKSPTAQGSPGIGGTVIVTELVPNGKLIVVLVRGLVVVGVVSVVVVSVPVSAVVVVVSLVVSLVVVVVVVAVVVGDAVRDVVVSGVNGLLSSEFDPPKISRMISTTMTAPSAPNRINAHGLRYHGVGGCSGGPGGGPPGGCWPYALYAAGCSE